MSSGVGGVDVVDGRGAYVGTVDMGVIMAAAETMRAAAHDRALGGDRAGPHAPDASAVDADTVLDPGREAR